MLSTMLKGWILSIIVQFAIIRSSSANYGYSSTIKNLVTFGDSYTYLAIGPGRIQWPDWVRQYLGIKLYDYARLGATCSNALTPRIWPDVTKDELPLFFTEVQNGTLPHFDYSQTVFSLWIGTNDVGAGCLLTGDQKPGVTIVDTISCTLQWIKTLYSHGARNFLIQNMVPLHRAPMYSANAYPSMYWTLAKNATQWWATMQQLTNGGNEISKLMLQDLVPTLPGAHVAIFDSYGLFTDIIDHPAQYLNGTAPFNVTGCANPCVYAPGASTATYCTSSSLTDQDSYVWFDELHASTQTNRIVAREISKVIRGQNTQWSQWL